MCTSEIKLNLFADLTPASEKLVGEIQETFQRLKQQLADLESMQLMTVRLAPEAEDATTHQG